MAVDLDLEKQQSDAAAKEVLALAVHPGYVATKMTGFYGEDDMDTCMSSLVSVVERFGTPDGNDIPNGGYVRWNGEIMAY
jgi:NAD(P)-dependent dehydrogenase (short-subunit alcohol dehydrogenase family)